MIFYFADWQDAFHVVIGLCAVVGSFLVTYRLRGGALSRAWVLISLAALSFYLQDFYIHLSTSVVGAESHVLSDWAVTIGFVLLLSGMVMAHKTLKPRA